MTSLLWWLLSGGFNAAPLVRHGWRPLVAMVAWSLWPVQVPVQAPDVGGFNAALRVSHGWSCGDGGSKPLVCAGPESPCLGARCWGALTQPPGSATDEEKDYQDMICLGRRGGRFSLGEKGLDLFSPWAFIRFIRIGMQIKLINHFQPVRVKQYKIYREPWGLSLSYRQSAGGP